MKDIRTTILYPSFSCRHWTHDSVLIVRNRNKKTARLACLTGPRALVSPRSSARHVMTPYRIQGYVEKTRSLASSSTHRELKKAVRLLDDDDDVKCKVGFWGQDGRARNAMKVRFIYCCLVFKAVSVVNACSFFPHHQCCSSAASTLGKIASIAEAEDLIISNGLDFQTYSNMSQASMAEKSLPKSLRILCFGDSLTAGYMSSDPKYYPYGDTLQTELAHMLSITPSQIYIKIDGLPGKTLKQPQIKYRGLV